MAIFPVLFEKSGKLFVHKKHMICIFEHHFVEMQKCEKLFWGWLTLVLLTNSEKLGGQLALRFFSWKSWLVSAQVKISNSCLLWVIEIDKNVVIFTLINWSNQLYSVDCPRLYAYAIEWSLGQSLEWDPKFLLFYS